LEWSDKPTIKGKGPNDLVFALTQRPVWLWDTLNDPEGVNQNLYSSLPHLSVENPSTRVDDMLKYLKKRDPMLLYLNRYRISDIGFIPTMKSSNGENAEVLNELANLLQKDRNKPNLSIAVPEDNDNEKLKDGVDLLKQKFNKSYTR
jgi:hypothetical protein